MSSSKKKFWKPLGSIAMMIGIARLVYAAFAGFHDRHEPLIGVFLALVAIPAAAPAVLGYFMWQGQAWATWTLRAALAAMLAIGGLLDLYVGLDVFSFPALAIPLIGGTIAWLGLSFA